MKKAANEKSGSPLSGRLWKWLVGLAALGLAAYLVIWHMPHSEEVSWSGTAVEYRMDDMDFAEDHETVIAGTYTWNRAGKRTFAGNFWIDGLNMDPGTWARLTSEPGGDQFYDASGQPVITPVYGVAQSADGRGDTFPGDSQVCAEFVLYFYTHADVGGPIIGNIAGFQSHCIFSVSISERHPLGNLPVAHARPQPAGDQDFIHARQQMVCQHVSEIIVKTGKVSGEILGNRFVAGIQAQQSLKIFLALGAKQGYRQNWVPQLHIEQVDVGDLKGGVVQINGIAHVIGRGQRVMGRLVRHAKKVFVCQLLDNDGSNSVLLKIAPAVFNAASGYGFGRKNVVCVCLPHHDTPVTGGTDLIDTLCKFLALLHFAPGGMVADFNTPGWCFLVILRYGLTGRGESGIGFVNDLTM